MSKKVTKETIINLIYNKGYIPLDFKFQGYKTKVLFKDKNEYKYSISWSRFNVENDFSPFYSVNPFALNNIKQYIKNNNIPVEILAHKYINSTTKMLFRDINGHLFKSDWNNIYNRHYCLCPKCYLSRKGITQRLNKEQYEKVFGEHGLTILDKRQIEYNNTLIDVIDKNGYKGKICYSNLEQRANTTFSPFIKSNPYTIDNIKHFIKLNNLGIEILSTKYESCDEPLKIKCMCGNITYHSWDSIKQRKSIYCSECSKSILEKIVLNYLKFKNIDFITEYKFEDCGNIKPYPFDFYLPKQNILIEVQGEQHYKPVLFGNITKDKALINYQNQIERDKIKENYCKKHNIPLLKLKYDIIRNGRFKKILDDFIKI